MKNNVREPSSPDISASVLEWLPLVSAFRDTLEWVLDIAADIAGSYPAEVAAVERVRWFMRARMEGIPATLLMRDALFTVALIVAAIERDVGPLKKRALSFKHPGQQLELAFSRARTRLLQTQLGSDLAA